MDTHFLPLPEKTVIPLYPASGQFVAPPVRDYRGKVRSHIANLFETDASHVLLAGSASKAIYAYLRDKNKDRQVPLRIALPAYMCISMLQAITSAGCVPVFIDLDKSLQIKEESLNFMVTQSCSYAIWPNYFGARKRNEKIAQRLQKAGILIIADEAQSFPFGIETIRSFADRFAHMVLFSFGPSKPLAGIGGGGLYMPEPDPEFTQLVRSKEVTEPGHSTYIDFLTGSIKQRINWAYPRLAHHLGITHDRGDNVVAFLETNSMTIDFSPITNLQAYVAYRNFRRLNNLGILGQHNRYLAELHATLTPLYSGVWQFLDNVQGTTAIVAIHLPYAKRRAIFETLAQNGLQATWYFLPLNELPRCKTYPSEDTLQTRKTAESIAIVAFQWRHSARQKQQVITGLNRAIDSKFTD